MRKSEMNLKMSKGSAKLCLDSERCGAYVPHRPKKR